MSDVATASATAPAPATPKTPKKAVKGKSGTATKKPRVKPTCDMVNIAIKSLKKREGSFLQAIKKYVAANYKVEAEKMVSFIGKYLKSAVTSDAVVQTKGKGASRSFKLATAGEKPSAAEKPTKAPKATESKTTTGTKEEPKKKSASSSTKESPAKTKIKKAGSGGSKVKETLKAPT